MDFDLDLSSRLENRIQHELLSDDADDLPLPGVGRRAASMTMSFDSNDSLRQSTETRQNTSPTIQITTTRDAPHHELDVDASQLNQLLLDTSDSRLDKQADVPSLSMASLSLSQLHSSPISGSQVVEPGIRAGEPELSEREPNSTPEKSGAPTTGTSADTEGSHLLSTTPATSGPARLSTTPDTNDALQPSTTPEISASAESGASPHQKVSLGSTSSEHDTSPNMPLKASVHDDSSSDDLGLESPSVVRGHSQTGSHVEVSTELPPIKSRERSYVPNRTASMSFPSHSVSRDSFRAGELSHMSVSETASAGHHSRQQEPVSAAPYAGHDSISVNLLTVPGIAYGNRSLPLGDTDLSGSHVDANRLLVYQHKLNETLTMENELLKSRIDELVRIIQHGELSGTQPDTSQAHAALVKDLDEARAMTLGLQRVIAEKDQKLAAYEREEVRPNTSAPECSIIHQTVDILQVHHEQLLHDKPSSGPDTNMNDYVETLHTALNHAHGVINTMRPFVPAAFAGELSTTNQGIQRMQDDIRVVTEDLHAARADLDIALREWQTTAENKELIENQFADTLAALEATRSRLHRKAHSLRSIRDQYTETSLAQSLSGNDTGEIAELEHALSVAQHELEQARADHRDIMQQRAQLDDQLEQALGRYESAEADAEQAKRSRVACEAQIDAQLLKIESLHQSLARRNNDIRRLDGEKAQLKGEQEQILDQLAHFERHLRAVRQETEHYGCELEEMRTGRREEDMASSKALAEVRHVRTALEKERSVNAALVFQKGFLHRALSSREWLYGRLCEKLDRLAPVLAKYGGKAKPVAPKMRLRSVALAVVAAYRIFHLGLANARLDVRRIESYM